MNFLAKAGRAALVAAVIGTLGACASQTEIDLLRADVQKAVATANEANGKATQALATANQALDAARGADTKAGAAQRGAEAAAADARAAKAAAESAAKSASDAQTAAQKMEDMFRKTLRK